MDYASNANKNKEPKARPPKVVERVTTGEVLIQKKGIGKKFKEVFIAADLKSTMRYITYDICIPAFQNLLVDSVSKGIEKLTYGDRRRRGVGVTVGPRTMYQSPIRRTVDNLDRTGLPARPQLTSSVATRQSINTDMVLSTRAEAEMVLEKMHDILEEYPAVSVSDLNSLVGLPSTHVDELWGWTDLNEAGVQQLREGYLLDLPEIESI